VFKRADLRFLANALAERQTHSGITTFELGLDLNPESSGNKAERAATILRHVFSRADADQLIVQMLNHIFLDNVYASTSDTDAVYGPLRSHVLNPRGVTLTEDGYTLPPHAAEGGSVRPAPEVPVVNTPSDSAGTADQQSRPAPAVDLQPAAESGSAPRDARKVFVVHGRDHRAVDVLEQFLQYLGLEAMAWSDAVALTGETQPHTYTVVKAGMTACAAVVVLFSPDDLARAKDEFTEEGDPDRKPQGQARQNVLLEAGMAFALESDRTIFVKSAPTREISDIAGFNWVSLDGRWDSRADLKGRLTQAGAKVRDGHYDLNSKLAGPFKV